MTTQGAGAMPAQGEGVSTFRALENRTGSNRLPERKGSRTSKMGLLPAGIGTPDARKRACPVRGALDGNLLSKGSKALSFDPGECITTLFYEVDEQLRAIPKHPEAHLWPSEVVTLGLLHARKGGGNRPFYRWLTRDYRPLFPHLPERTRLFRLFRTHQDWTQVFLAAPPRHSGRFAVLPESCPEPRPWTAPCDSPECLPARTRASGDGSGL